MRTALVALVVMLLAGSAHATQLGPSQTEPNRPPPSPSSASCDCRALKAKINDLQARIRKLEAAAKTAAAKAKKARR